MSGGPTPREEALWQALARTVRPLRPAQAATLAAPSPPHGTATPPPPGRADLARASPPRSAAFRPGRGETLDATWDRRLASGKARPDRVIDLHGLSRPQAYARLRHEVLAAHARGHRLILVVTGKGHLPGPSPADLMTEAPVRGALRAELPRWLAAPELSARIAAVRQAGLRQGGAGAVWLVLRRRRTAGGA
ncbi:MAG: Smr/MutS family protein [Sphingomonadaceae bacterium]|uniref:Smr/MutS family protein n=1 Tax=Thermaurantiacus sp. TaxID=2820283 RepID=UPI00298EF2B3|nr:Smr/MutS family protein [Thermaurantiacus sp.]MCS6985930.1 Smr/MutS family protein [Sphingomonadaceae bacterium]MDW8414854.1 Smr/MutS family protein [Thermaurantiacus sp.]